MSLQSIINPLAAELGLSLSSSSNFNYLLNEINRSALELYNMHDLTGCEREVILRIDKDSKTVSLPSEVERVIAVRNYDSKFPIELTDTRPRYMQDGWSWNGFNYYSWRVLGTFALNKKLNDSIHVRAYIPVANGSSFTLTITGSSKLASKYIERLVFSATDTTKTTLGDFCAIDSITKGVQTNYDINIFDDDNNLIACLKNDQLSTQYTHIQIAEITEQLSENLPVEILYKTRYVPLVEITDKFVFGELYDDVVYYNTIARLLGKQQGQEARVQMALGNATRILINITANVQSDVKKKVRFGDNQYYKTFHSIKQGVGL